MRYKSSLLTGKRFLVYHLSYLNTEKEKGCEIPYDSWPCASHTEMPCPEPQRHALLIPLQPGSSLLIRLHGRERSAPSKSIFQCHLWYSLPKKCDKSQDKKGVGSNSIVLGFEKWELRYELFKTLRLSQEDGMKRCWTSALLKENLGVGTAFFLLREWGKNEKKMLKQILYSAGELLLKYSYRIRQNQKLGLLN